MSCRVRFVELVSSNISICQSLLDSGCYGEHCSGVVYNNIRLDEVVLKKIEILIAEKEKEEGTNQTRGTQSFAIQTQH